MSKNIFSKIAKIGEEVRSAEPMRVEFGEMDVVINDIKNHNLNSTLDLAAQAQKMLKRASDNAYTAASAAEVRLNSLEKLIAKGKEFGFDTKQYESFKAMAQNQVQQAKLVAKILNDAQGKVLTAF